VRADAVQAWTWLALADRAGFAAAGRYLAAAAARLDHEQLAHARRQLEAAPA
jgi:hypothetical protein